MAKFLALQIKMGNITLEDVPETYLASVKGNWAYELSTHISMEIRSYQIPQRLQSQSDGIHKRLRPCSRFDDS